MSAQTFRDDDAGYEAWLTAHPSGWVANTRRSPSPAYLKLHRVQCSTISRLQTGYRRWTTGDYIKVCSDRRDELEGWAKHTLGAELQDGCHCVKHSGRRAGKPAARRAPVVVMGHAAARVVANAQEYRTIETAGLIPFEPRDATILQARATLRSMLGSLGAQPGELLHGIIEGPAVAGTDLDNALLYNVGGSINSAARNGVALERHTVTPGAATRYRYRLTNDVAVPDLGGEPVAALDAVPLAGAPRAWPEVWAAVRTSDLVRVLDSAPVGELGLHLRVGAPRFAGAANAQFVKTLIDGIMTALHAHGDRTTGLAVAERLAATVTLPAKKIAALLMGDQHAALGVCQRLVVLRGKGVQCQPEDFRVSVLRIELDRSASAWHVSGQVVRTSRR